MFRWNNVSDKKIFGMTIKMYRDPFVSTATFFSPYKKLELDHHAYKNYDSEVYMYRILDTNFEKYIEERGDIDRIGRIEIPVQEDYTRTIL